MNLSGIAIYRIPVVLTASVGLGGLVRAFCLPWRPARQRDGVCASTTIGATIEAVHDADALTVSSSQGETARVVSDK